HPWSGSITTRRRELQLALHHLWQIHPVPMRVHELLGNVRQSMTLTPEAFDSRRSELISELMLYTVSSLMQVYVTAPKFCATVSARPVASRLARAMAEFTPRLTNLRHELVELDEGSAGFVRRVDGTRTVAELAREYPDSTVEQVQRGLEEL